MQERDCGDGENGCSLGEPALETLPESKERHSYLKNFQLTTFTIAENTQHPPHTHTKEDDVLVISKSMKVNLGVSENDLYLIPTCLNESLYPAEVGIPTAAELPGKLSITAPQWPPGYSPFPILIKNSSFLMTPILTTSWPGITGVVKLYTMKP